MRARARALVAVIALASAAVPSQALGQEDKRAAAQILFDEARKLANEGKYAEACPKFAESVRLERGIGSMLWLADCYESLGKTASAWASFRDAATLAAIQHDPRGQVANQRAATLKPKLVTLAIKVSADARVPGLLVKRDDFPVGTAEFGEAVPVDPGSHTVSATAPQHKAWSTTVDVATGSRGAEVEVPGLEEAPTPPAQPPLPEQPPLVAPPASTAEAPGPPPGQTQRILGLAVGGAGVVGLGVGVLVGLAAKLTYNASNPHCQTDGVHCDKTGIDDRNTAFTLATVSTVTVIAGGVLAAGGAALFFTAPRGASASQAGRLQVLPGVSPHGASLALVRAF